MKLAFLPEASYDLRQATAWYRKEGKEVARRFLDNRAAILKRIKATPQQFPFVEDERQMALMTNFPYKIIFEQTPDYILIVAVAHTSRSPNFWISRSD